MVVAAFPPFNLALLVFVALVPWLISLKSTDPKGALRSGLTFGFLFWLGQAYFVVPFVHRWTGSSGLALVPWLLMAVVGMTYFALAAWAIQRCWANDRVWLIPLVWAAIEAGRASLPGLGFPWGLLATPLSVVPEIIQSAAVGTIYLVSAGVCLANLAVAQMLSGGPPRQVLRMASVVLALGLLSLVRWGQPIEGQRKVVTIAQPGVDMAFGDPTQEPAKLADAVGRAFGSAALQGSDLVVLPEGLTSGGDSMPPATPFRIPADAPPVLFGGQRGSGPVYQSAFAYDGDWEVVDKTRLVAFGEYVPFREKLPFLQAFNLPGADLVPGERVGLVELGGLEIGPVICFEALFHDVAQQQSRLGARLLAVMSIDDWYMDSRAHEQLLAASVFRAVENQLPVVRSASLGISASIDARGNIRGRAPEKQWAALRAEVIVPESSEAPIYRGLFPWLCGLALFAVIFEPWMRGGEKQKAKK